MVKCTRPYVDDNNKQHRKQNQKIYQPKQTGEIRLIVSEFWNIGQ